MHCTKGEIFGERAQVMQGESEEAPILYSAQSETHSSLAGREKLEGVGVRD